MQALSRFLVSVMAFVAPVLALAHAHLDSSRPANGSTLAAAPTQVALQFSDSLSLTAATLEKVGGKPEPLKDLPNELSRGQVLPLPKLGDGQYVLRYRGVSEDMHEAQGSLRFTVSSKPSGPKAP
ncbi:MAG: Copper resistance protein precursor [Pseudomonadota bacterium]|jgi:methionine-rich copper-binding protein CopC